MTVQRRRDFGYLLAALGAIGLIVSLWRPWYSFRIPQAVLDEATQSAQQLGALGPLMRQSADLLSNFGPLHVTAWQVYTVTPAVLLGVGVIAGGLSLLTFTGRAAGGGRLLVWVGVVGIALTLYRFVARPDQGAGFLHPASGMYFALIAAACIVGGGLIAVAGERDGHQPALTWESTIQPTAPPAPAGTDSVPPPAW